MTFESCCRFSVGALHAGEINYDDHGVTATAINLTFRLLDAPPPVNHDEVGEVWLRAGAYPRSCCKNEKLDQDVVFRDGWARMGDLGYLDDDGFLHLVNPSDLD